MANDKAALTMNTKTGIVPRILLQPDADAAARQVAQLFAGAICQNPRIVLGLATGGTPIKTYAELVRMHAAGETDFSQVTTFNLDEYVGLSGDHPQSFRFFMQDQLFDRINVDPQQTHVPSGMADDLMGQAQEYEEKIRAAGGIELQLLGIGSNGHIAFNEPGAARDSRTRVVELTEETIQSNARFFDSVDEVPRRAITMGIGTILEARRIVLLATGKGKAAAVRQAIEEPVAASCPASWLQTHPDVTYVLDRAAASELSTAGGS